MGGKRILTDEEIDKACELRERGWSLKRISLYLAAIGVQVSAESLNWTCLKQGADLPPEMRRPQCAARPGTVQQRGDHVVRRFSLEEDATLLALERQGLKTHEIARRMNRRPNSIMGRLATLARREARAEA